MLSVQNFKLFYFYEVYKYEEKHPQIEELYGQELLKYNLLTDIIGSNHFLGIEFEFLNKMKLRFFQKTEFDEVVMTLFKVE